MNGHSKHSNSQDKSQPPSDFTDFEEQVRRDMSRLNQKGASKFQNQELHADLTIPESSLNLPQSMISMKDDSKTSNQLISSNPYIQPTKDSGTHSSSAFQSLDTKGNKKNESQKSNRDKGKSDKSQRQTFLDLKAQAKEKQLEVDSIDKIINQLKSEQEKEKNKQKKTISKKELRAGLFEKQNELKSENKTKKSDRKKELRADIETRIKVEHKVFDKVPQKVPFIHKMIMNDIQPYQLIDETHKADKAFLDLLHVRKFANKQEFDDGVYFQIPQDPRGHKIIAIQAAADEKARVIEEQFKNLNKYIYDDAESKISLKSRSQQQALLKIQDQVQAGRKGAKNSKNQFNSDGQLDIAEMKKERVNVDIRLIQPSSVSVKTIERHYTKQNYQALEMQQMIENVHQDNQVSRAAKFQRFQDEFGKKKRTQSDPVLPTANKESLKGSLVPKPVEKALSPHASFIIDLLKLKDNSKILSTSSKIELKVPVQVQEQQHPVFGIIPGLQTYVHHRKDSTLANFSFQTTYINSINKSVSVNQLTTNESDSKMFEQNKSLEQSNTPPPLDNFRLVAYDPQSSLVAGRNPVIRLKDVSIDSDYEPKTTKIDEKTGELIIAQITPKKRKVKKVHVLKDDQLVMNKQVQEFNAILIKPTIDASDKEVHMRNQFGYTTKNLLAFIQQSYSRADFDRQVFKPKRLGEFSKNLYGVTKNVLINMLDSNFKKIDFEQILKKAKKPPLPPKQDGQIVTPAKTKTPDYKKWDDHDPYEWRQIILKEEVDDESVTAEASTADRSNSVVVAGQQKSLELVQGQVIQSPASVPVIKASKVIYPKNTAYFKQEAREKQRWKNLLKEVDKGIDILDRQHVKKGQRYETIVSKTHAFNHTFNTEHYSEDGSENVSSYTDTQSEEDDGRVKRELLQGALQLVPKLKAQGIEHNETCHDISFVKRQRAQEYEADPPILHRFGKILTKPDDETALINQIRNEEKQQLLQIQKKANEEKQKLKKPPAGKPSSVPSATLQKQRQQQIKALYIIETLQAKFTKEKNETMSQKLDTLKGRVAKTSLDDEYPELKQKQEESKKKHNPLEDHTITRSMTDVSMFKEGTKVQKLKAVKGILINREYKLIDDGYTNIETKSRRPNGGNVQPVRSIDPVWMKNITDANRKEEEEFQRDIKNNVPKRSLDIYELQSAVEEGQNQEVKKDLEYRREGHKPIKDQVEDAILNKYKDFKQRLLLKEDSDAKSKQLSKVSVVDTVLQNKNYLSSLANHKRIWMGEEGRFAKKDLINWFRVFNTTQLRKTQNTIQRIQNNQDIKQVVSEPLINVPKLISTKQIVVEKDVITLDDYINS